MNALASLQEALQAYVLNAERSIVEQIDAGPRANRDKRLRIYYDAYRLRLIEALASDFDALEAMMGDAPLQAALRAYVEAHPSVHRNVRWYGSALSEFLRRHAPWRDQPWLAEIAAFEWTLTLAFDAADAVPLQFAELAVFPSEAWGSLQLHLHPSVHLLQLAYNAPAFKKAVDQGEALPQPELADPPVTWLVWRKALSPHFRSLDQAEAWALQAAQAGTSFPEICEGLCDFMAPDDAPGAAAGWLRTWIDEGLIARATWSGVEAAASPARPP